jgi:hypothetical protein
MARFRSVSGGLSSQRFDLMSNPRVTVPLHEALGVTLKSGSFDGTIGIDTLPLQEQEVTGIALPVIDAVLTEGRDALPLTIRWSMRSTGS